MDEPRYLTRLGDDGPLSRSAKTLHALHQAHVIA